MTDPDKHSWVDAADATIASYRRMIDATVAQLTDNELLQRPAAGINSVAILLRHLGGNLSSRWTDFLTTDGEKPNRQRESEFSEWTQGRDALMTHFDSGWAALTAAVAEIRELDSNGTLAARTIEIRGEPHTIPAALWRSITHLSYHAGQIAMVARMVHKGEWNWLTVAPGKSAEHNQATWGTSAARSVFAGEDGTGEDGAADD